MDSDDTIDENFINTSYQRAIESNSDIVVLGEYYCKRSPNITALPTCALFLNHKFLLKNSTIRFPKKIQPCEDGLFSHQLLALTQKVSLNFECEYYYRQHENQNHHTINKETNKVINQIPKWLEILENFYVKNELNQTKALHLALFLEHEPFEFRYLNMPLNIDQKVFLHKLIKEFYFKNISENITKKEVKSLSKPFLKFIKKDSAEKFDKYYNSYLRRIKLKNKILRKLINFIPISKFRKKLKLIIDSVYNKN